MSLTATDLRRFPVWEYADDEDQPDETWIRPLDCPTIPRGAFSQLVATDFVTPADRRLQGFMVVTTAQHQVEITPGALVGTVGYCVLPLLSRRLAMRQRAPWAIEARDRLVAALAQTETAIFPMRYSLRARVRGERDTRHGLLN